MTHCRIVASNHSLSLNDGSFVKKDPYLISKNLFFENAHIFMEMHENVCMHFHAFSLEMHAFSPRKMCTFSVKIHAFSLEMQTFPPRKICTFSLKMH